MRAVPWTRGVAMNTDKEKLLVAERAAEWLTRLETAGPEERAEFWKWLTESPLHGREMLIAKANHTMLALLFRDRRIDTDTFMISANNVHEIESHQRANGDPDRLPAAPTTPLRRAMVAPTAARRSAWKVAAVVSFMTLLTLMTVGIETISDRTVLTGSGEWRTTLLADGTLLHAGPRTRVSVEFTERQRVVRLARGEAMFHVAKDRMRPFLVETDLATARAVGTAFAVSRVDPDSVVVTVKEGVVAVARRTHSRPDQTAMNGANRSATLRAGEQARITEAFPLAVKHVDVRKELAWVNGWLEFDQETIAQAAHQFNLRNRKQIKILNPAVAQHAVRGAFRAAHPESFAAFLERQGVVSVVNDERGTLLLAPYPDAVD